jgi:hypothetical protein
VSYRVTSGHVESLHNGRMVGPGEDVNGVNPRHPHDKRLIDGGVLVKRAAKKRARTTGDKPAAEPQKEDKK